MELRHLRYFMTVAETGSFTRASEKLCITQPSLSQQIKELEREVGVGLLDRSSRHVKLTDEGQVFKIYAKRALDNANQAVAIARQVAQQKQNQIHIGFLNVAELKVIPELLAQLRQHIPNLKIHLHSLTCTEQIQKLKNAQLDICFTRYCLDHADFDNILVMSEKIFLVGAVNLHPTERILKIQELKNHTLIMCEKNASPIFYEKLNQLIPFDQQQHDRMLWVTNVMQHLNLINMGMGLSFIPEYLLKFLNQNVKVINTDVELPSLGLFASYSRNSNNAALNMIIQGIQI